MLINVLGKKSQELFDEFAGKHGESWGTGDVKYHQGFSADFATAGGNVHLALAFRITSYNVCYTKLLRGKTPVVIWLVERLQAAGYRPGVVSRGYGGQAARYPLLLTPTTTTTEAGDEPVLIARRTGCPVAVAPKRAEAVRCLEQQGVDVILCDDGLDEPGRADVHEPVRVEVVPEQERRVLIVITSYSIHYTKLYEACGAP